MDVTVPTRELTDERPRVGETFAGRYRIEAVLGEGGFGTVYAARDGQLERDVAIKVLDHAGDAVALARFLQEAKTIAALDSEHVITVHEVALAGKAPYLVMERLRGSDLAELLKHGALPVATAVDYVVEAALGIAHAHGKGIVHRDLKPRNLFLAERADGTSLIKVLDFGVAKAAASELTETGAAVGTTRYMAPEQLKSSRTVDARTDIWAFGAVLYELIAGVPAFAGTSAGEIGVAILTEPHRPLHELADVSPELSAVVDRCLAKDPEARYADTGALVRALGADASRVSRVTRALAAAPGRHGIATRKDSDVRETVSRVVPTTRRTPTPAAPRRGLVIGACLLGLGGIAFGVAMAMRAPGVERIVVIADAAPAPVVTPDAAAVVVVVEDAPVVDAAIADARAPRPRPAVPKPDPAVEGKVIETVCNKSRAAAPMFLRPGELGGAYGCRQLGLLGCAGIERECAKYAVTEAEKLTCRNFIIRTKRDGCP